MTADGPLDLGCTVTGTSAAVALWNPGSSAQPVAAFAVNFNGGGTLIAENQFNVTVNVAPGTARTVTVPAPAGSTTCGFAWWNP